MQRYDYTALHRDFIDTADFEPRQTSSGPGSVASTISSASDHQSDEYKAKYERLQESYKRLQRNNISLEEKLLNVSEKFNADKNLLSRDLATQTQKVVEAKLTIQQLNKENFQLKSDLKVALQLLQNKPNAFVHQKLANLPTDLQVRVRDYYRDQEREKLARSAGQRISVTVSSSGTNKDNDEAISAAILAKVLEQRERERSKDKKFCIDIGTQTHHWGFPDSVSVSDKQRGLGGGGSKSTDEDDDILEEDESHGLLAGAEGQGDGLPMSADRLAAPADGESVGTPVLRKQHKLYATSNNNNNSPSLDDGGVPEGDGEESGDSKGKSSSSKSQSWESDFASVIQPAPNPNSQQLPDSTNNNSGQASSEGGATRTENKMLLPNDIISSPNTGYQLSNESSRKQPSDMLPSKASEHYRSRQSEKSSDSRRSEHQDMDRASEMDDELTIISSGVGAINSSLNFGGVVYNTTTSSTDKNPTNPSLNNSMKRSYTYDYLTLQQVESTPPYRAKPAIPSPHSVFQSPSVSAVAPGSVLSGSAGVPLSGSVLPGSAGVPISGSVLPGSAGVPISGSVLPGSAGVSISGQGGGTPDNIPCASLQQASNIQSSGGGAQTSWNSSAASTSTSWASAKSRQSKGISSDSAGSSRDGSIAGSHIQHRPGRSAFTSTPGATSSAGGLAGGLAARLTRSVSYSTKQTDL
eukprot:TRINITY_DN3043_c0_g1_i13.p1 TRINITY_DN3043_c0_g1~~TRINITY_DN3043_c0_g1_i13.p1  ORF type:complete len:695 (-),score=135.25 TRINITY_DN3043_c0_g1_i13:794-2878(-)